MEINGNYGNYQKARTSYADSTKGTAKAEKTEEVKKNEAASAEKTAEKTAEKRTDSFTHSNRTSVGTDYRSKTALGIKNEAMKDVVAQMLGKQAQNASGKSMTTKIGNMLKSYGIDPIKSDGSEDFWGAEKTAGRILDMAKSLAGDDKAAFEKVKSAFEKGFDECEKIWGGKLPSVCYDTLDKVRQGFDEWEKEFSADKTEE